MGGKMRTMFKTPQSQSSSLSDPGKLCSCSNLQQRARSPIYAVKTDDDRVHEIVVEHRAILLPVCWSSFCVIFKLISGSVLNENQAFPKRTSETTIVVDIPILTNATVSCSIQKVILLMSRNKLHWFGKEAKSSNQTLNHPRYWCNTHKYTSIRAKVGSTTNQHNS